MENVKNRTIGDGYTTLREFSDLKDKIASYAGKQGSEAYNKSRKELEEMSRSFA